MDRRLLIGWMIVALLGLAPLAHAAPTTVVLTVEGMT